MHAHTLDLSSNLKRIKKDIREYMSCRDDFPNIAAGIVDEKDIRKWHINLRASDGPYAQSPVHLELFFPPEYPFLPPTIKCLTPIQHPNVFDDYICLDLLKAESTNVPYEGWSPGYTFSTILLQLQSFLFSENVPQEDGGHRKFDLDQHSVQVSMQSVRRFKCSQCDHRHNRPWPAFPKCAIAPQNSHELYSPSRLITITGVAAQNESSAWQQVFCETFKHYKGKVVFEVYIDWIGGKWTRNNIQGGLARVGWGLRRSRRLGEDSCSIGYGGTAKLSFDFCFEDFGIKFGNKDTITTCVDLDKKHVAFAVNGKIQEDPEPLPFKVDRAHPIHPICLFKNGRIVFNFGRPKYNVFKTYPEEMEVEQKATSTTWSEHLPENIFLDVGRFLTLEELTKCLYVCKDWRQCINAYSLCARREVHCFVTKQLNSETTLGMCFGIKSKGPRLGEFNGRVDFISKGCWKTGYTKSLWGETCSDFLVFPINSNHAKRADSDILLQLREFTKKYESFVKFIGMENIDVQRTDRCLVPMLCDLMNKIVCGMAMSSKLDDRFLLFYSQVHHLMVYIAEKQGGWGAIANENLKKFISGPRNKRTFSDLGAFLPLLLLITDDFDWQAFVKVFTKELFARNVRWYAQKKPWLSIRSMECEGNRIEAIWGSTEVSRRIVMFQINFFQMVRSTKHSLTDLNSRLGQLSFEKRRKMMKRARAILKCKNWKQYFQYCDHPIPSVRKLSSMFRNAWQESLDQGYHREVRSNREHHMRKYTSCEGLKGAEAFEVTTKSRFGTMRSDRSRSRERGRRHGYERRHNRRRDNHGGDYARRRRRAHY